MAQGMYANICLAGTDKWVTSKMTVTTEAVTVAIYENIALFDSDGSNMDRAWRQYTSHMGFGTKPVSKEEFVRDLCDLIDAVSQVDKTTFVLGCGTKFVTFCVGEPVVDDADGFLEMSWQRKQWWTENPHISPILEAIHIYNPSFEPWKGKGDMLISLLFASKSSLLPR